MFVVHCEEFSAASVGRTVKTTTCEKCACDYQYDMTRRGMGVVTTVYGIGRKIAKDQAARSAAAHLNDLLAHSHDPVPCPDCGWIQSYMVASVRHRAYRRLSKGTWVLSILTGISAMLGLGVALNEGAASVGSNQYMLFVYLMLGAAVIWIAGVGGRAALAWLTINPNRGYSQGGTAVPATPSAVRIRKGTKSNLIAPAPRMDTSNLSHDPTTDPNDPWVTVQIASATFPRFCCSCLKPTDSTHNFRCGKLATCAIPICPECNRRRTNEQGLMGLAGMIGGGFLIFTLNSFAPRFDMKAAVISAGVGAFIGIWVGFWLSRWAAPLRLASFNPQLNTVQVRFDNPGYRRLMIDSANGAKAGAYGATDEQTTRAA